MPRSAKVRLVSGGTPTGTIAGSVALGGVTGLASAGDPSGTIAGVVVVGPASGTGAVLDGTGTLVVVPTSTHTHGATLSAAFTGDAMTPHDHDLSDATATLAATFAGNSLAPHDHDLSGATATLSGDPIAHFSVLTY